VPGATRVNFETLPASTLPDELRASGYDVEDDAARLRRLSRGLSWVTMEPLAAGLTRSVAETRAHAGIVEVKRYVFAIL
jgi:hypothetical protein